jgi:hypothetical protein
MATDKSALRPTVTDKSDLRTAVKIIFFITHHTLTLDHAQMTVASLRNSIDPITFDRLYIYNTHQEEISNEVIRDLLTDLPFVSDIREFPQELYPSGKSLVCDVRTIVDFCFRNYQLTDSVLLLKSDCLLSVNFLNDLKKLDRLSSYVFTAPFIVAKKRVTNEELLQYSQRKLAILSDEETFFNENESVTPENDHRDRVGEKATDFKIKYISCTCKRDFSCHYMTVDNLLTIATRQGANWGGCWLENSRSKWIGSSRAFTLHKYHSIVSDARPNPREGTIEEYMLS